MDWRRTLAAAVRGGLSAVAGRVDFSYRRLSRRTPASPGIVLPGLCRPRARVVVVVDTSGSVTDGALGQALGEVDGVLRGAGVREVRVLACDAAVHATARVRRVADVVLAGGGGTDMAAGINAAVATRPAPDLVVVLTDGFTPWPSTPPPARVVVGLLAPGTAPPSWATVVVCHG